MTIDLKKLLAKYKYPLIVLLLGLLLFILPGVGEKSTDKAEDENQLLSELLSRSEGVGEARVLISEYGVVVVCDGAERAAVRLNIINAVRTYTGFSADRITVLKTAK